MAIRLMGFVAIAAVASFAAFMLSALLLLAPAPEAIAQTLGDPTRPVTLAAPPAAGAKTPGAPDPEAAPQSELKAIWSVGERRYALVDGAVVGTGDRLNGLRVLRITDTQVVLRGPDGPTTLRLDEGIDKRVRTVGAPPAEAPRPRRTPGSPAETKK